MGHPTAILYYGFPFPEDKGLGGGCSDEEWGRHNTFVVDRGWELEQTGTEHDDLWAITCHKEYAFEGDSKRIRKLDVPENFDADSCKEIAQHFGLNLDDVGWYFVAYYG